MSNETPFDRVAEFVRQWEAQMAKPNGGKTDLIYSVHFDAAAGEVELKCSDLRALVIEAAR